MGEWSLGETDQEVIPKISEKSDSWMLDRLLKT